MSMRWSSMKMRSLRWAHLVVGWLSQKDVQHLVLKDKLLLYSRRHQNQQKIRRPTKKIEGFQARIINQTAQKVHQRVINVNKSRYYRASIDHLLGNEIIELNFDFQFKTLNIRLSRAMQSKGELTVCKNFRLCRKLGTGAFGEIYLAENKSNPSEKFAAKLQQTTTKFPQLYYEAKMYKYLNSFGPAPGIPKIYSVTTEGQYNIMLMDLLGSSLEDLFTENGKRLSLKTVLQLGEQILDRIEFMHEKNILHRDIKPDNFLMGVGKNAHLVYIVDFGLSKKFTHENKHIPYKEGKQLTGTARYASINTHMGIEQSRRDDIESIGYVMMYLLRGVLPWMSMKAKDTKTKYKMIMEKKISTPAEFLVKGFPGELAVFINYAKGLKFEEKPDYKYLKGLLTTARKSNKIEMDGVYDWTVKPTVNSIDLDFPLPQKSEISKPKEEKFEYARNKKEDVMDQALNNFKQVNSAAIKSSQPSQKGFKKDSFKDTTKSLNQSGQITNKNQNSILGSVGLETLITTKITIPKISVIKK